MRSSVHSDAVIVIIIISYIKYYMFNIEICSCRFKVYITSMHALIQEWVSGVPYVDFTMDEINDNYQELIVRDFLSVV
jgi:hypothetical protein